MKSRTIIATLLLLAAGLQTASAQTVVLKLKNNKTVSYSVSDVDSISFSERTLRYWVDLGLPSGTLWATCNVGANTPEESGNYFAWGETEQKEYYDVGTYKHGNGVGQLTKYCTISADGDEGFTDGLTELLPEDDAATANWSSEWQMPSQGQMEELFDENYTTVSYVTQNDVVGCKITSLINGKSIFLPGTGYWYYSNWVAEIDKGLYWTRSLNEKVPDFAMCLFFRTGVSDISVTGAGRQLGLTVRPVRVQETPYQWPVKEISFSENKVVLNTGETKQVTVDVQPSYAYNKTLAWESDNEAVATVDSEGNVTGVTAGSCTITCRATDGSGVSASITVTVAQTVTRISLNPTSLTLSVGKSETLTATVYPDNATNKTLSWESSDTNIATVDQSGKVTAKAKGNCTITCRATDGSGKYATCRVTVVQYVTGISIRSSISLAIGNSQTLSVTVYPSDASNPSLSWSSSDSNIASVNQSGTVTAKAKGTCTITCRATDGSGTYATCKVTVLKLVTGIKLSQSSLSMLRDIPQQLTATVLPADASNTEVRWSSSNTNIATVTQQGWVTAKNQGNCIIYCQAIDDSGVKVECQVKVSNYPQYVDLGLPSGTLWATLNIGANSPWEVGDYFAWGEKEPNKAVYNWSTYSFSEGSYNYMTKYNANDGKTELDPADDAASVIWGVDWQMPSSTQRVELMDTRYVNLQWTTQSGVYGLKVTSKKNGNYIFLPAGGYRSGSDILYPESGNYWSRSLNTVNNIYYTASAHYFSSSSNYGQTWLRSNGLNIRPVRRQ